MATAAGGIFSQSLLVRGLEFDILILQGTQSFLVQKKPNSPLQWKIMCCFFFFFDFERYLGFLTTSHRSLTKA